MRSNLLRGTLTLMALAALTACSDIIAPKTAPDSGPALASLRQFGGGLAADIIVDRMAPDSLSADITVTPTGGWFRLGNHGIFFPDHAICDPRASSYGAGTWDDACVVLDEPIQIHAEVRTQDGRSWVDFTPALRFVPSADEDQWVRLFLYSDAAFDPDNLPQLNILWSPAIGVEGIDEAAADSTQRTYVDVENGIAFRRIKHFSGYNVSIGIRDTKIDIGIELGL